MTIWKLTFDEIRQRPEISDILSALERGFEKFGIDFYLIGALAKDISMTGKHGKKPGRITRDIDLAVLINDKERYTELKKYLTTEENFISRKENEFVLIWEDKTHIDLMPFSDIADAEGEFTIGGLGFTIEVPGFLEIFETALQEVELEGKHRFKICTLPGIVILKLFAWDDRPEDRKKDIVDISGILEHYFQISSDKIYDNFSKLFDWENTSLSQIAATVLGWEMKEIAARNEKIHQRIERILNEQTMGLEKSKMAAIMTEIRGNTAEENLTIIQKLKEGFLR
jgi:predicted nucleotidyltransferase